MCSADTTPLKGAELKRFVEETAKQTGLRFEYGDEMLEKDDWVFDVLTNKEHVGRMKEHYNGHGDLLKALTDVKQEESD